jgi:ketosteroid isomerase-like protein
MPVEENKDLLTRYIEESNAVKGDITKILAICDKYYAPNFVYHLTLGDWNFEQTKQFTADSYKNIPDLKYTIEDMVAEGDKVVVRFTISGTHNGEFMGIAPTGRKFTQAGTSIYRIVGGKIEEAWWLADSLGLLQQLGVLPPMGQG